MANQSGNLLQKNPFSDFQHFFESGDFVVLLKQLGLGLLVVLALIAILFLIGKFFDFLSKRIVAQKGAYLKGISIRGYQLLNPDKEAEILLSVMKVFRVLGSLFAAYISLLVLFSIFPGTRKFTETLLGYLLNPLKQILLGFWHYIPNLLTIVVIVLVTRFILRGIKYLSKEVERGALKIRGFYPEWARPTYNIIRVLVYAFMFVVIFPYLPGSDSPVFQGVSVFLGVLISIGSAGSLSNVMAGIVLTYMRAFKIGDRVQIGAVTGDIVEKSLLVTRIRTIKNEEVTIPNSTILNTHTINYSSAAQEAGLILNTTVTIGYDKPWRQIHELLISAALATEDILQEPKPFVLQTALNDFYVSYQINAFTRKPNIQQDIYALLYQNIQDKFNEAGVEIMSPHYASLRDGNGIAIPPDYVPKEYVSPAFKISGPVHENEGG